MDYNYVRMRNAIKNGDTEKAEYYRLLYEKGHTSKFSINVLDCIIAILFTTSLLLGAYILYSEEESAKIKNGESIVFEETYKE